MPPQRFSKPPPSASRPPHLKSEKPGSPQAPTPIQYLTRHSQDRSTNHPQLGLGSRQELNATIRVNERVLLPHDCDSLPVPFLNRDSNRELHRNPFTGTQWKFRVISIALGPVMCHPNACIMYPIALRMGIHLSINSLRLCTGLCSDLDLASNASNLELLTKNLGHPHGKTERRPKTLRNISFLWP